MAIPGHRRFGLVGCVKQKAERACQAQDLYTSALFKGRRAYVERSCDAWWILSAAHGLVHPERRLAPYDTTLTRASVGDRRKWSAKVLTALDRELRVRPGDVFEIHAGSEYREFGLLQGLEERGAAVVIPTQHMGIGVQLQFYAERRKRP